MTLLTWDEVTNICLNTLVGAVEEAFTESLAAHEDGPRQLRVGLPTVILPSLGAQHLLRRLLNEPCSINAQQEVQSLLHPPLDGERFVAQPVQGQPERHAAQAIRRDGKASSSGAAAGPASGAGPAAAPDARAVPRSPAAKPPRAARVPKGRAAVASTETAGKPHQSALPAAAAAMAAAEPTAVPAPQPGRAVGPSFVATTVPSPPGGAQDTGAAGGAAVQKAAKGARGPRSRPKDELKHLLQLSQRARKRRERQERQEPGRGAGPGPAKRRRAAAGGEGMGTGEANSEDEASASEGDGDGDGDGDRRAEQEGAAAAGKLEDRPPDAIRAGSGGEDQRTPHQKVTEQQQQQALQAQALLSAPPAPGPYPGAAAQEVLQDRRGPADGGSSGGDKPEATSLTAAGGPLGKQGQQSQPQPQRRGQDAGVGAPEAEEQMERPLVSIVNIRPNRNLSGLGSVGVASLVQLAVKRPRGPKGLTAAAGGGGVGGGGGGGRRKPGAAAAAAREDAEDAEAEDAEAAHLLAPLVADGALPTPADWAADVAAELSYAPDGRDGDGTADGRLAFEACRAAMEAPTASATAEPLPGAASAADARPRPSVKPPVTVAAIRAAAAAAAAAGAAAAAAAAAMPPPASGPPAAAGARARPASGGSAVSGGGGGGAAAAAVADWFSWAQQGDNDDGTAPATSPRRVADVQFGLVASRGASATAAATTAAAVRLDAALEYSAPVPPGHGGRPAMPPVGTARTTESADTRLQPQRPVLPEAGSRSGAPQPDGVKGRVAAVPSSGGMEAPAAAPFEQPQLPLESTSTLPPQTLEPASRLPPLVMARQEAGEDATPQLGQRAVAESGARAPLPRPSSEDGGDEGEVEDEGDGGEVGEEVRDDDDDDDEGADLKTLWAWAPSFAAVRNAAAVGWQAGGGGGGDEGEDAAGWADRWQGQGRGRGRAPGTRGRGTAGQGKQQRQAQQQQQQQQQQGRGQKQRQQPQRQSGRKRAMPEPASGVDGTTVTAGLPPASGGGAGGSMEVGLYADVKAFQKQQRKARALNGGAGGADSSRPVPQVREPTPCRFWRLGRCSKGADCAFAHTGQPVTRLLPCCYFQKSGRCARGDACSFSHDPRLPEPCRGLVEGGVCPDPGRCPLGHYTGEDMENLRMFYNEQKARTSITRADGAGKGDGAGGVADGGGGAVAAGAAWSFPAAAPPVTTAGWGALPAADLGLRPMQPVLQRMVNTGDEDF